MMHLLAILAAYRVARMLALEDGPLDVFVHLRERLDPNKLPGLGAASTARSALGSGCR